MSHRAYLSGLGFKRVFERARARLEREPDAVRAGGSIQLRDPTAEERHAVGGLLGRTYRGKTIKLTLEELHEGLLGGTGHGLQAWLERLGGPLRDRPAEAQSRELAIAAALKGLQRSRLSSEPWFQAWTASLEGATLSRMVAVGELQRLEQAVHVLEVLPVDNQPIALFARHHAGGTKSLDGTPLERLCLNALALRAGVERPEDAEARRALWEAFGVVPDDLAAQVLVLNLPAIGNGPVDEMLRLGHRAGLPLRVTLQQLVRFPPELANTDVFVCENPAVLRLAAERLGADSAPVVTTEGQPSTAFWHLMRRVRGTVYARADFDEAGLLIGGAVLARTGGVPWRFDVEAYLSHRHENEALSESLPDTPWDPALSEAMAGSVRVEEEELMDALVNDLRASRPALDLPSSKLL